MGLIYRLYRVLGLGFRVWGLGFQDAKPLTPNL